MKKKTRAIGLQLVRKSLAVLPRELRHQAIRSQLKFYPASADFAFKIADTKQELEQAFGLLHDAYVREGFMTPHRSGIRVTPYHALPSTTTLVAKEGDKVVGTLSIIRRGAYGLPSDAAFDFSKIEKDGAVIAEISSLAVHKDYRGLKNGVTFTLLKFMYLYCKKYFGLDSIVIAVHPRFNEFYEAILGFTALEAKKVDAYDFANGNPAVGKYLDLNEAEKVIFHLYGRHGSDAQRNLFDFMINQESPNILLPDREYHTISDPVMTPELFSYFFKEKTEVFYELSEMQKWVLRSVYRLDGFEAVFNDIDKLHVLDRKQSVRYDVKIQGRLYTGSDNVVELLRLTVRDASSIGFKARFENEIELELGKSYHVHLAVGEFDIAKVVVTPRWFGEDQICGFEVTNADNTWKSFVSYMESGLLREETVRKKAG